MCGTVCSCDFIEWLLIYIGIIFGIILSSFGWIYFRLCFLITIPFWYVFEKDDNYFIFSKIMSYFDLGWDSVEVLYDSTFIFCILSALASSARY